MPARTSTPLHPSSPIIAKDIVSQQSQKAIDNHPERTDNQRFHCLPDVANDSFTESKGPEKDDTINWEDTAARRIGTPSSKVLLAQQLSHNEKLYKIEGTTLQRSIYVKCPANDLLRRLAFANAYTNQTETPPSPTSYSR